MRIDDGHQTLISFSLNAGVKLWEKAVTPPGISAGGPTDTTTMRNEIWRTNAPKHLKSLTPMSFTAAYDTAVYVQLLAMIGVNQVIEVEFADGSLLQFWGWLDEFTPGENVEGEQPTADCTIVPSNQDADGAEIAPVYIDSVGDTNDTDNP